MKAEQMKNNPLISVVVPAYNVSAYIETCISSLQRQTYTNFEIILVCQISPDHTEDICRQLARQYDNINLIISEKCGVSLARNLGLGEIRGEYVTFVDADDWIKEEFLQDMLLAIQGYDIAVCGFSRTRVQVENSSKADINNPNAIITYHDEIVANLDRPKLYSQIDLLKEILCNNKIGGFLWNKLFRADIIQKQAIRLDSQLVIGEDMQFLIEYMKYVKTGIYLNHVLYYYRYNHNSALQNMYSTKKVEVNKLESSLKSAMSIRKRMLNHGYVEWSRDEYYNIKEMTDYRVMRSGMWAFFNTLKCNYYDEDLLSNIKQWTKGTWNSYRHSKYSKGIEKMVALGITICPRLCWKVSHCIMKLMPLKLMEKHVNA